MIYFLSAGIIFGLSAGFAPGPLLALVVSETLHHGIKSGLKVALAPLITDAPVIAVTLFILSKLSEFNMLLGVISLLGGIVVCYIGVQTFRADAARVDLKTTHSHSLRKGVLVNLANPHPYLFWLSVGAPTAMKAAQQHILAAILFVFCFYLLLVGSKIILAITVGKSRAFLSGNTYRYTMKSLGIILIGFALFLFRDSFCLIFSNT
jgi:threonine/homoserine/homoserine lactone efflux protein